MKNARRLRNSIGHWPIELASRRVNSNFEFKVTGNLEKTPGFGSLPNRIHKVVCWFSSVCQVSGSDSLTSLEELRECRGGRSENPIQTLHSSAFALPPKAVHEVSKSSSFSQMKLDHSQQKSDRVGVCNVRTSLLCEALLSDSKV